MANCLVDVQAHFMALLNENRMPDLPNQTKIKIDCGTFAWIWLHTMVRSLHVCECASVWSVWVKTGRWKPRMPGGSMETAAKPKLTMELFLDEFPKISQCPSQYEQKRKLIGQIKIDNSFWIWKTCVQCIEIMHTRVCKHWNYLY